MIWRLEITDLGFVSSALYIFASFGCSIGVVCRFYAINQYSDVGCDGIVWRGPMSQVKKEAFLWKDYILDFYYYLCPH